MVVKKRVTIKDVAAMARVSTQTVSRVINDRPDVAEETRQRVWQIIEKLNYQPSAIARSLIHRRSLALGIVSAGLKLLGPSQTLNGIASQAEKEGYTLLLKELPGFYTADIQPVLNALLARHVEGIIWAVPEIGDNRDWIRDQPPDLGIPIIFLTMQKQPGVSIVTINNYQGGRLATEHLLEQGYLRIGHLAGPLDWWEARQRQAGWQDALSDAGLQTSTHHWVSGNWSAASGAQEMQTLLESYPDMDAVFIGNDQMALGALQVIYQRGLRVPEDLAIVGFDGIPETAYYRPPLTTVYQNLRELGSTAVRELIQAINASHYDDITFEPEQICLPPELIVRKSSIGTVA
ncbi:MAG: LacI family DNA-binding transcriptional regulator [Anaerolineae bacterium]|nr:LacI family DNA-binding transcriptional regulator [Anaerolineae bacterium]